MISKEQFLLKCLEVHGNRYNYDKVNYINNVTKIIITCKVHGDFYQTPKEHKKGSNCFKCSYLERANKTKKSLEQSIIESKLVHGDKYDYSLIKNIINSTTKANITCPLHGEFFQSFNNHIIQKQGCPRCSGNVKTYDDFIKKANRVHNCYYLYDIESFVNFNTKIKIICPIHGEFLQTPSNHIRKQGCIKCGYTKISDLGNLWKYSVWEKRAKASKYFDSFKVYIIKCFDENEEFIKIGKTYRKIEDRFRTDFYLPYNYSVLQIVTFNSAKDCSDFEHWLKQYYNKYKFLPLKKFGGSLECYSIRIISELYFNDKSL